MAGELVEIAGDQVTSDFIRRMLFESMSVIRVAARVPEAPALRICNYTRLEPQGMRQGQAAKAMFYNWRLGYSANQVRLFVLPGVSSMETCLLELNYPDDQTDETVVAMIANLVGRQLTTDDYGKINEHLTGEDYTIHERIFPALQHLVDIAECQKDTRARNQMTVALAVSMIYAVWEITIRKLWSQQSNEPFVTAANSSWQAILNPTTSTVEDTC